VNRGRDVPAREQSQAVERMLPVHAIDEPVQVLDPGHGSHSIVEKSGVTSISLPEALERFSVVDPVKAELVKLRYFGGLSEQEAAETLGISRATASRCWTFARAWLVNAIDGKNDQFSSAVRRANWQSRLSGGSEHVPPNSGTRIELAGELGAWAVVADGPSPRSTHHEGYSDESAAILPL
jgi:hypothetical protein